MKTDINPILIIPLILMIVYSYQKWVQGKALKLARHYAVSDVMLNLSDLICFEHGVTLDKALPRVLKSYQEFFPVLHATKLIGILKRNDLLKETITNDPNYVSSVMDRNFTVITPETNLDSAMKVLAKNPLIVVHDGLNAVGVLVKEKVDEYLLVLGLKKDFHRE